MVDPDLMDRGRHDEDSGYSSQHGGTHLLPHLPPNMCQPLLTAEAHCLETAVSQHLGNLRILLAVFTEDQLTLVVVVLVLSTSPVLSTLQIEWSGHARDAGEEWLRTFPLF